MELTYQISPDDYVAFNTYFVRTNPAARRSVLFGRIQGTVLVLAAGGLLGALSDKLTPLWIATFVLAAALFFLLIPKYMVYSMGKKVRRMIQSSAGTACGNKTLHLEPDGLRLTGEGENSAYSYAAVQQLAQDDGHFYIFVGTMEALILPLAAFPDAPARDTFCRTLEQRMEDAGKSA